MSKYGTLKDNEGNKIYPNAYYKVGDVFITTNEENPATRFGGTWQKLPDETYLMTASTKYKVKSTGGENQHTLTVNEIPSHQHTINGYQGASEWGAGDLWFRAATSGNTPATKTTISTGGGQAHNNMPKFYVVYVWIRVA